MATPTTTARVLVLTVIVLLSGGACSGDSGTEPTPEPIAITITGVEEGMTYESSVTIDIAVSRGTYQARLDGETFLSGRTVTEFGSHTLTVTARDGLQTTTETVEFSIGVMGDSWLIVRMFDLGDNEAGGGGDAILLTDSANDLQVHALVDAGPAGVEGSQPGYVASRLETLGVSALEAVILSHGHSDHFQGLPAVFGSVDVERFIYNGQVRSYNDYTDLIAQAHNRADEVIVPTDLLTLSLSGETGTQITVIPAIPDHLGDRSATGSEINEGSLGARVERGGFEMFLTGDGEYAANARWRTEFEQLSEDVEVLKVGHHGANNAIFDSGIGGASSWLTHTDPEIILISANGRSHPRENALTRIKDRTETRTYCTHVHGQIELRVSPAGEIGVTVERNATDDCVPGTDAST